MMEHKEIGMRLSFNDFEIEEFGGSFIVKIGNEYFHPKDCSCLLCE